MKFVKVSQDAFKKMQLEAGLVLNTFDPTEEKEVADTDIVCTTSGGVEASCKPTYTNYADDVDNVDPNALEFLRLDGWECRLAFTSLSATAEFIRLTLGAADIQDGKIVPRRELKAGDAKDVWWVGDRADGGKVAIRLMNALSSDGFTLKTSKKGKGQLSCALTGHVSLKAQDVVPMEFYVQEGAAEAAQANEQEVTK